MGQDVPMSSTGYDKMTPGVKETENELSMLIRSITMDVEDKIAIEHSVNNLSREFDYMLDRIDSIVREHRSDVLKVYRKLLLQNMSAIDNILQEFDNPSRQE